MPSKIDSSIDIAAYLDGIHLTQEPSLSYDFLSEPDWHHVFHVPFENLDMRFGREISLAPADLFDKISLNHRGGCCFESNRLFQLLLEGLGFQVYSTAARVLFGTEKIPPKVIGS